ncbi:MAG: hypothetical protein FJ333_08315 [Sphingomonadales bacterium]|nr:hypothetical protein [Sphingomonadales bacterium]
MFASEILNALQNSVFKNFFYGICAADTIPKNLKENHFIIVNTDKSTGEGKHWYAIVRRQNVVECFDSLGVNEEKKNNLISKINFRNVEFLTFNTTTLQPAISLLCGQYVLFFLFERYLNLDMDFHSLLNEIFDDDQSKNDENVKQFYKDFILKTGP